MSREDSGLTESLDSVIADLDGSRRAVGLQIVARLFPWKAKDFSDIFKFPR